MAHQAHGSGPRKNAAAIARRPAAIGPHRRAHGPIAEAVRRPGRGRKSARPRRRPQRDRRTTARRRRSLAQGGRRRPRPMWTKPASGQTRASHRTPSSPTRAPTKPAAGRIYVECTGDRVILQPEGHRADPQRLRRPAWGRESAGRWRCAQRASICTNRMTPTACRKNRIRLLLIRPDGIDAYCAAREAMSSWSSDFGYELIDQDWKLELSTAEPASWPRSRKR